MQNLLNIFTKYQTPAEYYFGWFKDQKNNVPENLVKELLALRKAVFALLKSPNIVDDPELGHFTDLIKSLNPND